MTNPDYTHAAFVVDRSGSMLAIAKDMNGGITTLLEEQAQLPGKILIDVVTFDGRIETPFDSASPEAIIAGGNLVVPRGATALYDAIGSAVVSLGEKLSALPEEERPGSVIVTVVTDGHENASVEWTKEAVKTLVDEQTDKYNWNFVFLGANINSSDVGGGLGFRADRTMQYTATAVGATNMMNSVSNLYGAVRSGKSARFSDEDRKAASEK